jgi:hypothetical protein
VDTLKDSGDATSAPAFDLLTAIREEQANRGRHLTDSELDRFARAFYAPEYRRDLRRIMAVGCEEPNEYTYF